MAQSVSVATSTSAAVTAQLVLNPLMRSTTVILTGTGATSSNSTVQLETSLTDPSAIPLGGPAATWALLSSATGMASSAVAASGLIYTVLSPIGAVRINSTSGSTGGTYTFTPVSYTHLRAHETPEHLV